MGARMLSVMVGLALLVLSAQAFEAKQVFRAERFTRGNVNLRNVQPIDGAAWIWLDGVECRDGSSYPVVRFRREFESDGSPLVFDVTADPRFVLTLDGREMSRGPHKGFVAHWYYQTYEVTGLAPGRHVLEANVFYLGDKGPLSILTSGQGGFALRAEGTYDGKLSTGKADWRAAEIKCMSYGEMTDPDTMTGCENIVRGTGFLDSEPSGWHSAKTVRPPIKDDEYGFRQTRWALYPTERLDEISVPRAPGAVRAAQPVFGVTNGVYTVEDSASPWTVKFSALLAKGEPVTVPAGAEVRFIWDFDDYVCAFPQLETSGGRGAEIRWAWAESLYGTNLTGHVYLNKGNRGEFVGKRVLRAMHDTFLPDGREHAKFTTPWWKCGRWAEISIRTSGDPLTLERIGLVETRSPMEPTAEFACDDPTVADVRRICVRGMQNCLHEMFMDCPYFEQQMYPGDTRVEMLVLNAISGDDRLLRFGIGILDAARRDDGMVPMNFPCANVQDSTTYSMCWAMMLGDYALWQGTNDFLRARIPGLRQTLSAVDMYRNADGLLEDLPAWSFVDWVPEWGTFGNAPDGRRGVSSVNNLLYVHALKAAARVESACGDPAMAAYWNAKAAECAEAVVAKFWNEPRGMIADTLSKDRFSEHAQCLALLADVLSAERADRAFKGLVEASDLARATVYFSHYLFETYFKFGRADLFLKRLDLWRDFVKDGLKTPLEAPGWRGRSDCHAWGAHPLYHMQTGLAGIRPAENGYAKVRVEPQPGGLAFIKAVSPTPKGFVYLDLRFDGGKATGTVVLPPGLSGEFVWKGRATPLKPGMNEFLDPDRKVPLATIPQTAQGLFHSWDPYPNWWADRHQKKMSELASYGGKVDLVLLGDSITHNWEGARGPSSAYGGKQLAELRRHYSTVCLGYGGDDTRNILWRVQNGEFDGYEAKCVMMMVGTNNPGNEPPAETAAGVKAIIDAVLERQPRAKILLLGVFPCGEKPEDDGRVRNRKVNEIIRGFADGERIVWCDFGDRFIEPDGTILKSTMGDFLHPGPRGYAIWLESVLPHLRRMIDGRN